MAEEEKAPSKTENLIHVSPEFGELVSEAIRSRRPRPQDPDVEGHGLDVEQFSASPGAGVICGYIYADN
jgi:hypothetical protein